MGNNNLESLFEMNVSFIAVDGDVIVFPSRVDQEVIVDFENGNSDCSISGVALKDLHPQKFIIRSSEYAIGIYLMGGYCWVM